MALSQEIYVRISATVAGIVISFVGLAVFIVQPGLVQALVESLGLSAVQAGTIASGEMFGIAGTTIVMSLLAGRLDWRTTAVWSLTLATAANFVSVFVDGFYPLLIARIVAGLGAGCLISIGYGAIGLSRDPDRNFGFFIAILLTYSAIFLFFTPAILDGLGGNALFVIFGLLTASGFMVVRALPRNDDRPAPHQLAASSQRGAIYSLCAVLLFFFGQGMVWAYLFVIGTDMGLDAQHVATGLTISQFAGIAGALLASYGARLRFPLILLGSAGSIVPLYFLAGTVDAWGYGVSVTVFNFAANLLTPMLIALVATYDPTGVQTSRAAALQMIGLAVGPALAATLIAGQAGYDRAIVVGAALFAFAFLATLPLMRRRSDADLPASVASD